MTTSFHYIARLVGAVLLRSPPSSSAQLLSIDEDEVSEILIQLLLSGVVVAVFTGLRLAVGRIVGSEMSNRALRLKVWHLRVLVCPYIVVHSPFLYGSVCVRSLTRSIVSC